MHRLTPAILALMLGVFVIAVGIRRSDSATGVADTVGTKVANAWDGKARLPEHVWYYVGGGTLILVGVLLALRQPRR